MYHPSTLLRQSRNVHTAILVASLIFISLVIWIACTQEVKTQPVKLSLLTGSVIILLYINFSFTTRKTLFVAKNELRLRKVLQASLRRQLEKMGSNSQVVEVLEDLPDDAIRLLVNVLSSPKKEGLTRHVGEEIFKIEVWQSENEEPDGKTSDAGFETRWIEMNNRLSFLLKLRKALD